MGGGSVAEGVQRDFFTEADRNILSKQDVMSWTHDYGFHVYGTSWTSASDNPLNTALETGTTGSASTALPTPATKATAPSWSPWPS